jgi:hypothetical protein
MKKKTSVAPGTFLRVPLPDGTFAYGRALTTPYVAFYNYRTSEPSTDLATLAGQPVLFTLAVRALGMERWTDIGQRPLEPELNRPIVQFMQDLVDFSNCTIFDTHGFRKQATPQECIGLERATVWEAHGVEQRLLDHFLGRPNDDEIEERVRLQ